MSRAVALFSGGLDSSLAIRILQEQGFEVEALNVRTTFDCCRAPAARAAAELGARLTVLSVQDDYLDVIRRPTYGYGRGMNPCLDCRIYMCKMASRFMQQTGACVVITGEILGQRPMSQKRRDLDVVAYESGLEGRLLRPLSARLLQPTVAELQGQIDRRRLYGFSGRGRKPLIELAKRLGIGRIPGPSTGCALTETTFAPRVRDLMRFQPEATLWEFELLNVGRHFRFDPGTKVVVGRREEENLRMEQFFHRADAPRSAFLHPEGFVGPDALLVGPLSEAALEFAAARMLRYTRTFDPREAKVRVTCPDSTRLIDVRPNEAAGAIFTL